MKKQAAAILAAVMSVSGCAVFQGPPAEEVVRERAQLRLDLLMNGGWKKAYELASPNYRATAPVSMYSSRYGGAGMWLTAKVDKVACEGESPTRCDVLTVVTYKAPQGGFVTPRILEETWIYVEDNWYKFEE